MKTLILTTFLNMLIAGGYNGDLPKEELKCLTQAVYHEARGEPAQGQVAVAHVVLNRVASNRYPKTICEVVFQPSQFTNITRTTPISEDTVETAVLAYVGFVSDPTDGALFYHNPDKASPRYYPLRVPDSEVTIGRHTFYNLKKGY